MYSLLFSEYLKYTIFQRGAECSLAIIMSLGETDSVLKTISCFSNIRYLDHAADDINSIWGIV